MTTTPEPINATPRPCVACEKPCTTEGQLCPDCAVAGHRVTDDAVMVQIDVAVPPALRDLHVHRWAWADKTDGRAQRVCFDCGRQR